jgi:capsular polysaccharide biosynthesis protein
MSKHTPGPWNLYPNNASDWVVRKMFPDGQESHEIARCQSGVDNARLIAAAPDLLAALKMAVSALERSDYIQMDGDSVDVIDVSRAAIAKAVGEES